MVALAPFSTTISERMKAELGRSLPEANTRWIGRFELGARGYADHGAVAHHGGVERHRHVVGRDGLADMGGDQRIAFSQGVCHRADRKPRLRRQIGQFGHERAIDKH